MTNNRISLRLTLPLTEEAQSTLKRFLHMAKEGASAEVKSETERRRIVERIGTLRTEVEALEKRFDGGDLDALEKLTSKKSQLAVLASKSMEPKKTTGKDPWYNLMISINDFLRPYFVTVMDDLRDEITARLTPFFRNERDAAQFVGQMPIIATYQNWFTSSHVSMNHRAMVNKLIPVIENILAGKEFWTFEEGR